MEKGREAWQLGRLRSELIHGRNLARQLRARIKNDSLSSRESIRLIIDGLLNSCAMSISMLTSPELPKHQPLPGMPPGSRRATSIRENSVSNDADQVLDALSNNNKSGKRKCVKRVTKITLAKGAGLETALEDGYGWKKYGQKDILGFKYPRGYYKCTHKITEGCLARKQVQRIDEQGPPAFNITYYGVHTCMHLQHQLSNSQLSSTELTNYGQSIPTHETPFPEQQPYHANDILQHSELILPSDILHIENMNIPSWNSMSLDVGYHPSFTSSTTCLADICEVGFHQSGSLEWDIPSAIVSQPGSATAGLYQPVAFDPFSEVNNWHFGC